MKIVGVAIAVAALVVVPSSSAGVGPRHGEPTPPQEAAMIASYNATVIKDDRCTQAGFGMQYSDFSRAEFTWAALNAVCVEPVRYGYDTPIFHHLDGRWNVVFIRTFETGPPPCRLTPRRSILRRLGFLHCSTRRGNIIRTT